MKHIHHAFPVALLLAALPFHLVSANAPPTLSQEPETKQPALPPVPEGFDVPTATLLLRARALDADLEYARTALAQLGAESLDRVTVELLMAVTRGREQERRDAAADALITIGERAARDGHKKFAGNIGESIYLSSVAQAVRERAHVLFMLLDTESARRHR